MNVQSRSIVQYHLVNRNKINVQPRTIVMYYLVSRNKMKSSVPLSIYLLISLGSVLLVEETGVPGKKH